jgi:hypothetical protein
MYDRYVWFRFLWLFRSCMLLVFTSAFIPPAMFAYDEQHRTQIAYAEIERTAPPPNRICRILPLRKHFASIAGTGILHYDLKTVNAH